MNAKEIKRNVLRKAGSYSLKQLLGLLCKTLRVKIYNARKLEELESRGENIIFAFWHGTMIYPWYYNRKKKLLGLTSRSKDGDVLANLLRKWNYEVARGSSSRGGSEALDLMVNYASSKGSVAITPDGPRGPRFKMKAGAVVAAKKAGVPIILAGTAYKKKYILSKNWDKFEIPKFFTRVNMVLSDPVYINSDLSREETEKMIKKCEDILNRNQKQAGEF